jgi:DNA-binding NtrC family response regulator
MSDRAADLDTPTWITGAAGASTLSVRRCRLEVLAGPDLGLIHEVESTLLQVGARRGCDLVLNDDKVSGHHFEIALDERGYRLRDLGSKNGTWIGPVRVMDAYVAPGTTIHVGTTRLRFQPLGESVQIKLSEGDRFGGQVGRSMVMRELFARLERLAPSDTTVLVTGETGTGKELVAEALHEHSPRSAGPFVVVDCGSIPANLIESDLFGHEKGAFTGATSHRVGAFERASGGTIFIDEIGELPLELQPKLLRVLEQREVRRVGGGRTIPVDIRVIAATNRDLAVEVNHGRFREDLYYRLAVARVHVPPLRDRREDILLLVEHFRDGLPGAAPLDRATLELMMRHDWPGNVRELRNAVERLLILAEMPSELAVRRPPRPAAPSIQASEAPLANPPLTLSLDLDEPFRALKLEFERAYVQALLEKHGGNITSAARVAGLDRVSIHKMLHRLGLR